MKCMLQKVWALVLLCCAYVPAHSQVDIKVFENSSYVSKDTLLLTIDPNDNSGTGATGKTIYFNIYNLSPSQSVEFNVEAEWLCSNSSVHYQYCQQFPSDYTTGVCHPYHHDGIRTYDNYYPVPPDTCSYNYLRCHLYIYDYSVEPEYEKICRFTVKRKQTNEILDVMYLIIRRGDLPCSGPNSIRSAKAEDMAEIYPNPAWNVINIETKQGQIAGYALYTPDGRMVLNRQVISPEKRIHIDIRALANGVYYLKLTDRENKAFYKKIVVDH